MKLLFLLTLFYIALSAEVWWVSQSRGDDNNSGRERTPFKTLSKALKDLQKGDTIKLETGNYVIPTGTINKSFNIVGIPSNKKTPNVSGKLHLYGADVTIENVNFNDKGVEYDYIIYSDACQYLKMKNVELYINTEKGAHGALKTKCLKNSVVELSNVEVHDIPRIAHHRVVDVTESAVVKMSNLFFNNSRGIIVSGAQSLDFRNVVITNSQDAQNLVLVGIKRFGISSLFVSGKGDGLNIVASTGVVENTVINAGVQAFLGNFGSNVLLKNVDIIGNSNPFAPVFQLLSDAKVEMLGGKLVGNSVKDEESYYAKCSKDSKFVSRDTMIKHNKGRYGC